MKTRTEIVISKGENKTEIKRTTHVARIPKIIKKREGRRTTVGLMC